MMVAALSDNFDSNGTTTTMMLMIVIVIVNNSAEDCNSNKGCCPLPTPTIFSLRQFVLIVSQQDDDNGSVSNGDDDNCSHSFRCCDGTNNNYDVTLIFVFVHNSGNNCNNNKKAE